MGTDSIQPQHDSHLPNPTPTTDTPIAAIWTVHRSLYLLPLGVVRVGGDGMPPSDLVELTHLHEPAIVHALRCRYKRDLIYTNTGSILLAINPFKKLDHLYTREVMESFWNDGGSGKDLPPHVYAVAERSYSNMIKSLEHRDAIEGELIQPRTSSDAEDSPICNQSILVSGER